MMYDYMTAMTDDVLMVINDEYILEDYQTREQLEDRLNDDLWDDDSVTGNGSGSYTCNRAKSKMMVVDNIERLRDAVDEFGISPEELGRRLMDGDWEWMDVTIRCSLLPHAISMALDEIEDEYTFGQSDDDDDDDDDQD